MSNTLGAIHSMQQWTDRVFVHGRKREPELEPAQEESRMTKYVVVIILDVDAHVSATDLMNHFSESAPTADTVSVVKWDVVQDQVRELLLQSAQEAGLDAADTKSR